MTKLTNLPELSNFEIMDMVGHSKYYLGCYPKDGVPKKLWKRKGFIVINMDDQGNSGTHWVYLQLGNKDSYYIDSFGLAPPTQIANGMKATKRPCYFNDIQLQDKVTSSCGWWVCMFAIECAIKGRPVVDVLLDDFTYDTKENEKRLIQYWQ